MRRLGLLALVLGCLAAACEDDTAYKAGHSTFQNDKLDGGAAGASPDAAADGAAAGAPGTGGNAGTGGSSMDAGQD